MTTSLPAAVLFDAYGTLIHFPDDPSPFDYMADALRRAGVDLPRARLDDALHAEMRYYKAHYASVRTADDLERLRIEDARVYLDALGDTGPVRLDLNDVADELAAAFESRVLPDAHAAIDRVRAAGVRAAVLSNFSYLLPLVSRRSDLPTGWTQSSSRRPSAPRSPTRESLPPLRPRSTPILPTACSSATTS